MNQKRKLYQQLIIFSGTLLFALTAYFVKTHLQPFNIISVLSEKDPVRLKYEEHLKNFSDEQDVYVLLESKSDLSQNSFLYDLSYFSSEKFKSIMGLQQVQSLYEAEYPVYKNEGLHLESFFENRKLTNQGKKILLEDSVFKDTYLDSSQHASLVYLKLRADLTGVEKNRVLARVLEASTQIQAQFKDVHVSVLGTELARFYFVKEMVRSQVLILPLVISVILGLLFVLFKSIKICLLSLFVMLLSYTSTLGLIIFLDGTLNPFSSFALLFILIISTTDLVHLFSAVSAVSQGSFLDRVKIAKKKIYRPSFVCAVTTWVGLLSLVLADLPPIIHFGIYCAFGVALCFFLIFHLLPLILNLFQVEVFVQPIAFDVKAISKIPGLIQFRWFILVGFVLLMSFLAWTSKDLQAGDNLYRKFVTSHPLSQSVDKFSQYFQFTGTIDVTLTSSIENQFLEASHEKLFQDFESEIKNIKNVSRVKSLANYLNLLRSLSPETFNRNEVFTRNLKLQSWYKFFEQNNVFEPYVASDKKQLRMMIFLNSLESEELIQTQEAIEKIARLPKYKNLGLIEVQGFSTVRASLFHSIYTGFIKSFLFDFIGIFICFLLFFKSLKWSVIAMIPNLLPVLAVSGFMGILNMTVEYNLIVLIAIIFGIAVDDTTHFIYYLLEKFRSTQDIVISTAYALQHTSVALLGTTFIFCITIPAFFLTDILMFSQVALILILALLLGVCGDFFVLPALLFVLYPKNLKLNLLKLKKITASEME